MAGRLIISLDFELMWGVRDHKSISSYGDAVLGGRHAIPMMLGRFKQNRIHATWATVGLLFARNRDEMLAFAPAIRPTYTDPRLSPYPALKHHIGRDETADPHHFGRSLLDNIADTEGQEIATHTYGHIYALEPGMTPEAWRADLTAAIAIAENAGHRLRSIVFPRNQFSVASIQACRDQGLSVFRGNPSGTLYRPRPASKLRLPVRAARFVDGVLPIAGPLDFAPPQEQSGTTDVPASRFLRPWNPRFPAYSRLHLAQILREMTHAARNGRCYHLWWHPHNMGRDTGRNMDQLDRILNQFARLRDDFGFESATMAEAAAVRA
ncbi:polysaccharide deacetylase family protein [Thalassovita sp.]|uniref:polysaccharide deacetylase family protein n=1 Tax=Thalassovita sp. TaxID=1979401 RepID=UPI0029DE7B97|nr:polysaccharide deacetylase family protein [Thalassovita sp.]